jgi:hypothetical protein
LGWSVPSGRNRWRLQDYVTAGGPVLIRELASGPPVVQRVGEFVGVDAFGLSRHGEDDWPQADVAGFDPERAAQSDVECLTGR